ncbi:single-stranded-DNA-specific exonuclease RecJ [Clostridium oryzae]|uniref:Single-stranded-DNA-specific exonuclease RecJ n=1 Tax=Clostridium oryzae TaxID=1450648 RepID=A0A1V4ILE8_9CLOT|nr:single-stranded-DNA-specific exonuclease RecJ [Clostridium oryzae]OPJ60851.1 single-stranded-DNA-specific exonuclease RecJ [Clostridium oryzae]
MLKNIKFNYKAFSDEIGTSQLLAKLLVNRDIYEKDKAIRYINADLKNLYDGSRMKDMDKGVNIIKSSIEKGLKILIVGDYDVDGVISTYILFSALSECGANVEFKIPDRVKDGYGINENIIKDAKDRGVDTIITCDNGIAAFSQLKLAVELGINVVVTDHHDIQFEEMEDGTKREILPEADAVINPKQNQCTYPFKALCGAGIAYKFSKVLYKAVGINELKADRFIEYAAIATVCDVVDLIDENRILVKSGLHKLNNTQNIGLKALFKEVGIWDKEITVYSLGFIIGPSINASGRLEQALWALKLLISENEHEAEELAKKLHALNVERQQITNKGLEKAIDIIENSEIKDQKVKVIYMPDIHESVAGIIAGRIKERYNSPTFVITKGEEGAKGSGRSIEEYNMFQEMLKCKHLLQKFGGHPMAAGLSLKEEDIIPLQKEINERCTLTDEEMIPKIIIDMPIELRSINLKLAEELRIMEPFGKGNSKPVFACKSLKIIKAAVLGAKKNVIKMKLGSTAGNYNGEGILFQEADKFEEFILTNFGREQLEKIYAGRNNSVIIDIAFNIDINEYNGNKSVQLNIRSYRKS